MYRKEHIYHYNMLNVNLRFKIVYIPLKRNWNTNQEIYNENGTSVMNKNAVREESFTRFNFHTVALKTFTLFSCYKWNSQLRNDFRFGRRNNT